MNGAYKPMPLVLKDPPKAAYSPLPMHKGCGSVHLNRFRICARVPTHRASVAHIGAHLAANMPRYMTPDLAAVRPGDGPWNGRNTLKFRAVMRIRPFAVPVPLTPMGFPVIAVPVPANLRNWMAPDVHTDSVGIIQSSANGFTVQTLKREYEDEDDGMIRQPLRAAHAPDAIASFVININQHHFLAGRRSFRFDSGRNFGYDDDRLVFETAAIERYSHPIFEYSQIAVGNIPAIVRRIWCQMAHRFCETHGLEKIVNEPAQPGWSKFDLVTHAMQPKPIRTPARSAAPRSFRRSASCTLSSWKIGRRAVGRRHCALRRPCRHRFHDPPPSTQQQTEGVPIARNAVVIEAGFDLKIGKSFTVGAGYSGTLASGARDHAFKGNFAYMFYRLKVGQGRPVEG